MSLNTFQYQARDYLGMTGSSSHLYVNNDETVAGDLNVVGNLGVSGTILGSLGVTMTAFYPTITPSLLSPLTSAGATGYYTTIGQAKVAVCNFEVAWGTTADSGAFSIEFPTTFFSQPPIVSCWVSDDSVLGISGSYLTGGQLQTAAGIVEEVLWRPQSQTLTNTHCTYIAIGI